MTNKVFNIILLEFFYNNSIIMTDKGFNIFDKIIIYKIIIDLFYNKSIIMTNKVLTL